VPRLLIVILILALLVRFAWALGRPTNPASLASLPDQAEYLSTGRNLLEGQGLKFTDPRFDDVVWAFRTPGYPLLVAACGASVRMIHIVQALLDTSTVLAVFLLARRWLPKRWSLLAAAIVAVDPFLIYFTGLILTETLFTCLLVWGMVLLVLRNGRWWLLGGAILAVSVLVRPGAIALPTLLALVAAIVSWHPAAAYMRSRMPAGATMILLTAAVLLPWAFRNSRVVGHWIWTSTNSGFTAFDGFNPDATGASNQSFIELMPQLKRMDEVNRCEYLSQRANQFVREQPARSMELAAIKVARTWSPQPLSKEFSRPLYIAAAWIFALPLYLLTLAGVCYGTMPRIGKLFLIIPAIYFTVAAAVSVGSLRYRVPAEAPLAIVAAAGAAMLFEKMPEAAVTDS